jgi:predicted kinase
VRWRDAYAVGTRPDRVLDLRGSAAGAVPGLCYPAGDVLVVSGLPGSGKSTLMRRAVAGRGQVRCVDSQDTRERYERRLPLWLPYALYRPLVRLAHYRGLARELRSGRSLVVHDCGSLAWVRRWLAREARRHHRRVHLLLMDVTAEEAAEGQRARGRAVSAYAFARHLRAARRLVGAAEAAAGRSALPPGCASAVLIDRPAARELREIAFADGSAPEGGTGRELRLRCRWGAGGDVGIASPAGSGGPVRRGEPPGRPGEEQRRRWFDGDEHPDATRRQ